MTTKHSILLLLSIFVVAAVMLSIYVSSNNKIQISKPTIPKPTTQKLFQQWIKTQNKQDIQQYQSLIAGQIKQPPSLFDLTYNSHPPSKDCVYSQFSLPPRADWQNIIKPLKIIERLQSAKIINTYQVTSLYRDQVANKCIRGAKASKHLDNSAIDIQLVTASGQKNEQTNQMMCDFWRNHGATLKMGLGLYGNNKFHIDAEGFRTWGKNYKSTSSPCIHNTPV